MKEITFGKDFEFPKPEIGEIIRLKGFYNKDKLVQVCGVMSCRGCISEKDKVICRCNPKCEYIPDLEFPGVIYKEISEKQSKNSLTELEDEFYRNCAIAAMQGIQENGTKLGEIAAELFPEKTSKLAFDMADAMLKEYRKRKQNE